MSTQYINIKIKYSFWDLESPLMGPLEGKIMAVDTAYQNRLNAMIKS